MKISATKHHIAFSNIIYSIFIIVSLLIVADFVLPGTSYTSKVIKINKELQQYYNAARNYHFSYKLFTNQHSFYIAKSFAQNLAVDDKISYSVSPIFKEINSCRKVNSDKNNIYSLRIISGLVLPILTILIMISALKYRNRISILTFVFQILLILNLIYLII